MYIADIAQCNLCQEVNVDFFERCSYFFLSPESTFWSTISRGNSRFICWEEVARKITFIQMRNSETQDELTIDPDNLLKLIFFHHSQKLRLVSDRFDPAFLSCFIQNTNAYRKPSNDKGRVTESK
jgi:hypothetical protein